MGNCLVTKLKGSVNNPNLPKLGEMRIPFGAKSTERAFAVEGSAVEIYDSAGTLLATSSPVPANVAGYVVIKDKYNVIDINFSNFRGDAGHLISLADVKYSPLINLLAPESEGSIEDLPSSLVYIQLLNAAKLSGTFRGSQFPLVEEFSTSYGNTAVHVAMSEFANMPRLRHLQLAGDASLISGDVLSVPDTMGFLHIASAPGVTGNMNTLCDRMYANGKHSGSLTYIPNNTVTKTADAPTVSDQYIVDFTESGWHNRTA